MSALSIPDQVRQAFLKQNRTAAAAGAILGAFVPLATGWLAHYEVDVATWHGRAALVLMLGGLVYSASTVYGWALVAFKQPAKAAGFVVLVEGTLTLARAEWLAVVALALLVVINAIAAACAIALDQRATRAAARAERAPKAKPQALRIVRPSPRKKVRRA